MKKPWRRIPIKSESGGRSALQSSLTSLQIITSEKMKRLTIIVVSIYCCCSLLLNCKANNFLSTIKDKELLIGLNFRVSSYEFPPFMSNRRGAGGNVVHSGSLFDLVEAMKAYFQMKVVFVPVSAVNFVKNGPSMSLIHQLQNDEVDLVSYVFMNILERKRDIDLSYPIAADVWFLMQPFPNETSRLEDPIKPFTSTVWLFFIMTSSLFVATMTVIMYTRKPSVGQVKVGLLEQTYRQFEYVIKLISSQGSSTLPEFKSFLSFRLMIALWLLMMVVIDNSYTGTYTANLAVPKLEPTIETLEQLAASEKFRMTIDVNTDLSFKALEATSGPFKVFGDTFRKHPDFLITQPLKSITNVVEHNCVYPCPRGVINYFINADVKAHDGICRLTVSANPLSEYLFFSLGLQKGSPYTEIISQKFILRMWENGWIDHVVKKYSPPMPAHCSANVRKPGGPKPLKLADFAGAFVLLLIGFGFAKLIFIAELLVNRLNKRISINMLQ